jgi:hypothetical protein
MRQALLAVGDRPSCLVSRVFGIGAGQRALHPVVFSWVQSGFNLDLPLKADLIVPFFRRSAIRSVSGDLLRSPIS